MDRVFWWIIALAVVLVAFACFGPHLLQAKPDASYSLPVTKGDLYFCTMLVIFFGGRK